MSRSGRRSATFLLSLGLLAGACTGAGPTASATPGAGTTTADPVSSATSDISFAPSPSAPSPSVVPAASPSAPDEPSVALPPIARLAVDGGDPVEGQLGSFTWANSGSDAPWLDGNPIHVGAGERLTLTFVDPVVVANWTASRVPPGQRSDLGAIGVGEGSGEPIAFDAPPPGSWSIGVDVWFSDFGSGAYYWLVTVD